jgi:hypothetical protein
MPSNTKNIKEIFENSFEHLPKNRPKFRGKGIRRVKSGLALNRGALNRGFTVYTLSFLPFFYEKNGNRAVFQTPNNKIDLTVAKQKYTSAAQKL